MIHYGGGRYFRVFDFDTDLWSLRTAPSGPPGSTDGGVFFAYPPARLAFCAQARTADGESSNSNGVTWAFSATPIDAIVSGTDLSITNLTATEPTEWPLRTNGYNTGGGWSYCPADKCIYSFNGQGGSNKYWKLSPPVGAVTSNDYLTGTWTLSVHTFASGALSAASSQSWVYNRLSWDAKSRSFLWFPDSVSGPVQAFRPHGV